ncbi:response regulator [Lyngbya aestuarii]|uniref:response regulator n=1 Tax=Lyngbya aestuarii TaxID=118322 RepID=UPI00403DBE18
MKLKTKLLVSFLGIASLVVLLGFINIFTKNIVNSQIKRITSRRTPELIALEQIKAASLKMIAEVYSYALIESESANLASEALDTQNKENKARKETEEFTEASENLQKWLSQLDKIADTPEQQAIYQQLEQEKKQLEKVGKEIIILKAQGVKGNGILIKYQNFKTAEENFLQVVDKGLDINLTTLNFANEKVNSIANFSVLINLLAVLVTIITSVILGLLLSKKILKPVKQLQNAANEIGEGKLSTRVDVNTQDELQFLAEAFNLMAGQLEETTVSKAYLDNIIGVLSDSLIVLNKDFRIQSFNQATLSLSGYQQEELLNQPLNILLNQNTCLSSLAENQAKQNNFLGRKETSLLTKDSKRIPVSVAVSAMKNTAGQLEGIVCLVQNILARKEAEAALRRQGLMFETIYDGVIITNLQGRIVDWNPAAERMFGYQKAEVLGKTSEFIYPGLEPMSLTKQMFDTFIGEGRWTGELEFVRKDGTKGICETVVVPLRDEYGQLRSTIGVNRDITERKQYENQLVEAREAALEAARAKAQFLANMSHEIRTPMNGVLGMSELLLTTELTPRQVDFVRTLQMSGEHLLTVINDVLDFSKLEAGEMRLDTDELDLNRCLEEVLDLCSPQAHARDLELALLVNTEVPRQVRGDAGRLRQVLTNLVGNAIKFTHQGEILIEVSLITQLPENGETQVLSENSQSEEVQQIQLRFAVKDTGIGIAPEDQNKLFQSFSQVDTSNTRKYAGTGLGLAICKQLVELMGGEIGVDSQLGVGSTFWFTGTFSKVATDSSQEAIAQVAPGIPVSPEILAGKRVLVVDDRLVNRQIVQYQLQAKGMEVDEAENGMVALSALQAATEAGKPYDVALLDMKMPKIDGSTLGRLILAEPDWSQTKLVLMTSMHAGDTGQPLLKSGFSDYLVKPVKESRLLQSLLKVFSPQQQLPTVDRQWLDKLLPEQKQHKSLKILLVEDTPVNLKLVRHQVRLLGYQSDSAENGQQALEKLATHQFDIVLMDCQMPVMDGYKATQLLRQREGLHRHTIVIGMTAYAMQGDREKCLTAGMDDYLSKPVMVKDLRPVLQQWSDVVKRNSEADSSSSLGETNFDATQLIDWPRLKEISGSADASFQLELVQGFVKDAETLIAEARQALAAQNSYLLANKAHQLKGASSSVAVPAMAELAAKLRDRVEDGDLEGASELVTELEKLLEQLKELS